VPTVTQRAFGVNLPLLWEIAAKASIEGDKNMHFMRLAIVSSSLVAGLVFCGACSSSSTTPSGSVDAGVGGGNNGSDGGAPATSGGAVAINPLVISAATRTLRTTTWSVNYWNWMPSYTDSVTGTDSLVSALKPAVMRVGGYNNDANVPDAFDNAAFDKAVAYAHSIGAEPLIQVPHLADNAGNPPTPDTAAAMVRYANITKGYGVKYFSVGNEPDLYATQGLPSDNSQPAINPEQTQAVRAAQKPWRRHGESHENCLDPSAFQRGNYMKTLVSCVGRAI